MSSSSSDDQGSSITEKIKCYVRCKPLLQINESTKPEQSNEYIHISDDKTRITIKGNPNQKILQENTFILDKIFTDEADQETIFNEIGEKNIEYILNGYNCTIFCYGQTGTGKTHTILGPLDEIYEEESSFHGLLPRTLSFIFNNNSKVKEYIAGGMEGITDVKLVLKCSCLELYQEHFFDLLSPNNTKSSCDTDEKYQDKETTGNNTYHTNETIVKPEKLNIREDPKRGMYVEGIVEHQIDNINSAKEILLFGLKNRHVAKTEMNAASSRSHLLFTLFTTIMYTLPSGEFITKFSRLHYIDLAGTERQYSLSPMKGSRIKEVGMINKSLSTLGNVINALTDKNEGKKKYIPFRDSKLTYFLKDSLGGNSKTTIIGNISQSIFHINETLSTLKFVRRAKDIKNEVRVNEETEETVIMLRKEIKRLKNIIKNNNSLHVKNGSSMFLPICPTLEKTNNDDKNKILNDNNYNNYSTSTCNSSKIDMDDLKNIVMKINSLIEMESVLKEKCEKFNFVVGDSINSFLSEKEKYQKKAKENSEKINLYLTSFQELCKEKADDITQMKNMIDNHLNNNSNQKEVAQEFIDKVTCLVNYFTQIQSIINPKDLAELERLKIENEQLKIELEGYKSLSEFYIEKENNDMKIYKDDINFIKEIVDKFIDSNTSISNFLKKNVIKSDINEDIIIINKMAYEKLQFQIEELQNKEDNYIKTIEEMQSENYLLTMELLKYQPSNNTNSDDNSFVLTMSPTNSEKNDINFFKKHAQSTKSIPLVDSLLYNREVGLKPMNQNDIELMKLKEKLDDTFLSLMEANKTINEKSEKIQYLQDQLLSVKIDKDKLDLQINDLNDQIDTMTRSNFYLESSMIQMAKQITENIRIIDNVREDFDKNEKRINDVFSCYSRLIEKYKKLNYSFKELSNENTIIKMEFDNVIQHQEKKAKTIIIEKNTNFSIMSKYKNIFNNNSVNNAIQFSIPTKIKKNILTIDKSKLSLEIIINNKKCDFTKYDIANFSHFCMYNNKKFDNKKIKPIENCSYHLSYNKKKFDLTRINRLNFSFHIEGKNKIIIKESVSNFFLINHKKSFNFEKIIRVSSEKMTFEKMKKSKQFIMSNSLMVSFISEEKKKNLFIINNEKISFLSPYKNRIILPIHNDMFSFLTIQKSNVLFVISNEKISFIPKDKTKSWLVIYNEKISFLSKEKSKNVFLININNFSFLPPKKEKNSFFFDNINFTLLSEEKKKQFSVSQNNIFSLLTHKKRKENYFILNNEKFELITKKEKLFIKESNLQLTFKKIKKENKPLIKSFNAFSIMKTRVFRFNNSLIINKNEPITYYRKQNKMKFINEKKISFEILNYHVKIICPFSNVQFSLYHSGTFKQDILNLKKEIIQFKENLISSFKLSIQNNDSIPEIISSVNKAVNEYKFQIQNLKSQNKILQLNIDKITEEKGKILNENINEIKEQNKLLLIELSNLKKEYKSKPVQANKNYNSFQHLEINSKNISFSKHNYLIKKKKFLITKEFFTFNAKFQNSTKENKKFKERIKFLFGSKFIFEDFFIDEKLKKYCISKENTDKLNTKFINLKLERQKLKNELSILKNEISKISYDNKFADKYNLLECIKKENIILRNDLEKLRKNNEELKTEIGKIKAMNESYYEPNSERSKKSKIKKSNSQKELLTSDYSFELNNNY